MIRAEQLARYAFDRATSGEGYAAADVDRLVSDVRATLRQLEAGRTSGPGGEPLVTPQEVRSRRLSLVSSARRSATGEPAAYSRAEVEDLVAQAAATLDEYVARARRGEPLVPLAQSSDGESAPTADTLAPGPPEHPSGGPIERPTGGPLDRLGRSTELPSPSSVSRRPTPASAADVPDVEVVTADLDPEQLAAAYAKAAPDTAPGAPEPADVAGSTDEPPAGALGAQELLRQLQYNRATLIGRARDAVRLETADGRTYAALGVEKTPDGLVIRLG